MVVTLVVFAGVRLAVTDWARPHLSAPLRLVSTFQGPRANGPPGTPAPPAGDWVVSNQVVNTAGQVTGLDGAISCSGGRYGILFGPSAHGHMTLKG
jgi:hypothetical protein